MDVVKRNLTSIICGVVALLAVVLAFYPLGGWFEDLHADMTKSLGDHTKIQSFLSQDFKKPLVDPEKSEVPSLGQFPTEAIIAAGLKVKTDMEKQSLDVMNQARAMNERKPLVAAALQSKGGSALDLFKKKYYERLKEFEKQLNATPRPAPGDVKNEQDRLLKEYQKKIFSPGPNQPGNAQAVMDDFNKNVAPFVLDTVKRDFAKSHTMYISEGSFDTYKGSAGQGIPLLTSPQLPTVVDVWIAQLSLWIQEDVVKAIADTNNLLGRRTDGVVSVPDAPVKYLVRITWDKKYVTKKGAMTIPQQVVPGALPLALDTTPGSVAKQYNVSPTGRVGNSVYDVVHFTVVVDVDATNYWAFPAMLTDKRFITVRTVDVAGVDRDQAQLSGFVFGKEPVVQLTLQCEGVFFRNWTTQWMPESVKTLLGVPPEPRGPVADAMGR